MNDKEIRFNHVECRSENDDLILEGYPIVWNQKTLIGTEQRGFYETIDKKSIDETILKDIPLRYNHNDSVLILARSRNKSLELIPDEKGLFMRAKLQKNVQSHLDVYNMVKTGLLDKMSFGFTIKDFKIERNADKPHRIIRKIGRLIDVSIVDNPAYDGTSVYARSLDLVETEIKTLESEEHKQSLDSEKRNQVELEKIKFNILRGMK